MEVPLHYMGDITHSLDDVTYFSPTLRNGPALAPTHGIWPILDL